MTYRVIAVPIGSGRFDYRVAGTSVEGRSSEPLFDACRQLKRMGVPISALCALYHSGSTVWAMRCPIWAGAALTAGNGRFQTLESKSRKCLM